MRTVAGWRHHQGVRRAHLESVGQKPAYRVRLAFSLLLLLLLLLFLFPFIFLFFFSCVFYISFSALSVLSAAVQLSTVQCS